MSYQWKIGELAVCEDDSPDQFDGVKRLHKGHVYIVTDIVESGVLRMYRTGPARITEMSLALYGFDKSWAYHARRFRPLDDSDKQHITEKYKDSLPKRSLVKDDDAARDRIEELNREVRE